MDESKAVLKCKQNDRKAQRFLFDAYSNGMLMICLRYVKNQADAEEVMLSGFYKFYDSIDRFVYGGTGSIGGWLKKIMINEALMFLRRQQQFHFVEEGYAEELPVDNHTLDHLSAGEIFKLIRNLPSGYRTVFNLFVVEGYSHKEIAEALCITEGTSKSQLNKARGMLQKMLPKEYCSYERQTGR
ncbi:RNA polymerase sigma factor [Taibaiella soli]|uniref:RNA polymerase subunit sigma-24 n=1 Tax=Taibaiella soli TaxID=1649169 RepID=A0A2W2BWE7_9BACT|nr:sigma-70 family RNA polymerase sigma factor [Taibaiella soli]PZF72173.1 RNA polymerase subunit sigma-24 [Taibaiella soli]